MKPPLKIYRPPDDEPLEMVRDGLPSWPTIWMLVAIVGALWVIAWRL